jgi:hypothetical protein
MAKSVMLKQTSGWSDSSERVLELQAQRLVHIGTSYLIARALALGRDGDGYVENKTVSRCVDMGARPEHGRPSSRWRRRRWRGRRGRRFRRRKRGCKQRVGFERYFGRDEQSGKFEHNGQRHQYGVRHHES